MTNPIQKTCVMFNGVNFLSPQNLTQRRTETQHRKYLILSGKLCWFLNTYVNPKNKMTCLISGEKRILFIRYSWNSTFYLRKRRTSLNRFVVLIVEYANSKYFFWYFLVWDCVSMRFQFLLHFLLSRKTLIFENLHKLGSWFLDLKLVPVKNVFIRTLSYDRI